MYKDQPLIFTRHDNENEQYSLSDDIKQYIENPEFIQQFKNAIAFLGRENPLLYQSLCINDLNLLCRFSLRADVG